MQVKIIPPIRGQDCWGSGQYQAPRGARVHNGVDLACTKGSFITAISSGVITKIGYPYSQALKTKRHLRYVQVTDIKGYNVRYYYTTPYLGLDVGSSVIAGETLCVSQGLTKVYKGIIDHIHFEVKSPDGMEYTDPHWYMESLDE